MKDIKIIVTAVGCPGASTFLKYLRDKITERKITIVGIDMNPEAVGRFMVDKFYCSPAASNFEEYKIFILDLIDREKPDLFFCVSSYEVNQITMIKEEMEQLGTKVIVSSEEALDTAGNKFNLYEKLKDVEGVKIPRYFSPKNLTEFIKMAKELGYPEKRVCFKPHFSKGSRGFRIIDDTISRKDLLLNYKPESTYISMSEFISIFENEPQFPDLMLMEYVDGEEIDAMVLSYNSEALLVTCKTRETTRAGVVMSGEMVRRDDIDYACRQIIRNIPLVYNAGIQFKGGYLIEINPRVSTFIYQDDLIEPYLSIKLALGEITPEEVKAYPNKIVYGRRFVRYMDQIFWNQEDLEQEPLRLI